MTFSVVQHLLVATLASGAQVLSVQVVDSHWLPVPGAEVRLAVVGGCADPKPSGEAAAGTTGKNGEVQMEAGGGPLLISASIEGFERREECVELGRTFPGEILKVQLRLRPDRSTVMATHPTPRPTSRGGDPKKLTFLDFVGLYRDSAGAFYYVSYSVRPDALALELPTGAVVYFRERDGLTFRSPQGVLSFRLRAGRLEGLSYTPKTIPADWLPLGR